MGQISALKSELGSKSLDLDLAKSEIHAKDEIIEGLRQLKSTQKEVLGAQALHLNDVKACLIVIKERENEANSLRQRLMEGENTAAKIMNECNEKDVQLRASKIAFDEVVVMLEAMKKDYEAVKAECALVEAMRVEQVMNLVAESHKHQENVRRFQKLLLTVENGSEEEKAMQIVRSEITLQYVQEEAQQLRDALQSSNAKATRLKMELDAATTSGQASELRDALESSNAKAIRLQMKMDALTATGQANVESLLQELSREKEEKESLSEELASLKMALSVTSSSSVMTSSSSPQLLGIAAPPPSSSVSTKKNDDGAEHVENIILTTEAVDGVRLMIDEGLPSPLCSSPSSSLTWNDAIYPTIQVKEAKGCLPRFHKRFPRASRCMTLIRVFFTARRR